MKILIIDHQPLAREGLKQILSEALGCVQFDEVGDPIEAIRLIRERKADLVVLEFPFLASRGLDFLKQMKQARLECPVLVLGGHPEELIAKWALSADAAGFVSRNAPAQEIMTAARKLVAGGRYISPVLAEGLAWDRRKDNEKLPHETLSQREFEVLNLIALGKSVTDIANDLHLSVKTVSTHRARILRKMGMKANAELILYAIRSGLVS